MILHQMLLDPYKLEETIISLTHDFNKCDNFHQNVMTALVFFSDFRGSLRVKAFSEKIVPISKGGTSICI